MALTAWLGRQSKKKQSGTITVTADDVATTYRLRVPDANGAYVAVLGQGTVAATATALAAAATAGSGPFTRMTFTTTGATGVITITAKTAGEPFTLVSQVAGGAGTIGAYTAVNANTSPNDFTDIVNFSGNATPGNGDTLVFDNVSVDALWNLDSVTTTPTAIIVYGPFQASVGLAKTNQLGQYTEFRGRYITLKSTTTRIGDPDGTGPNLFAHDNGATAGTWNVYGSGTNPEAGIPCVLLLGSSASNVLNQIGGSVGIAYFANETANFSGGINISGGSCVCGPGVTLSGIVQSGGTLDTSSALGTVTQEGGSHVHRAGNITALDVYSGSFELRAIAAMTITNGTIGSGATLDLANCNSAITSSNPWVFKAGATINDPNNCLGQGGTFSYSEPDGYGTANIIRGTAPASVAVT